MDYSAGACSRSSAPRRGRTRSQAERRDWLRGVLEHTVSRVFEIERNRISQPTRGVQTVAQARQVAMYLAHIALGLSMRATGQLFDRDRTTVAHAVHMIEDKRDCVAFDRAMGVLEEVVRQLAKAIDEDSHE